MLRRVHGAPLLAVAVLVVGMLAAGGALAGGGKVKNGNFETGTFKNWKRANNGAGSVFLYDQALYDNPAGAPPDLAFALANLAVPPPRGNYSAIIAQGGPGNHALYRKLKLPKNAKSITLRTFWDNEAGEWQWTGDFEYTVDQNEFFSIDLLKANADPFSGDGPKLLKKVFRPQLNTSFESGGWKKVSVKVRKFAGKKVLLRVAEVDNLSELLVGLDDVRIKKKKKR